MYVEMEIVPDQKKTKNKNKKPDSDIWVEQNSMG